MKITATIRENRPDKQGLCRIVLRTNIGSKRYYKTTELKVDPDFWENGLVSKKHPQAKQLNDKIHRMLLENSINEPGASPRFMEYTEQHIKECTDKKSKSEATIDYYNVELNKFIGFAGNLYLSEINTTLLERYHTFLVQLGNSNNTVWKAFKFINTILNKAVRKEIINRNPSLKMEDRPKFVQTKRSFLTPDEVNKIASTEYAPQLMNAVNWFLFQCHTGLAIADIQKLELSEVKNQKGVYDQRKKTTASIGIPLSKEASKLLTKLKPLGIADQTYNETLKTIAHIAGVKKNLTSHIARHTFAMRLTELKVSTESIAALLGHKKLSTTKIYSKIRDARVQEEFKGFGY